MSERRLGIVRRFSLADAAQGWTDECYLLYRPSTYADKLELSGLKDTDMNEQTSTKYMFEFIQRHLQGGKVMLLNDANELELADYEPADLDSFAPDTVDSLFMAITGVAQDPKGEAPTATS